MHYIREFTPDQQLVIYSFQAIKHEETWKWMWVAAFQWNSKQYASTSPGPPSSFQSDSMCAEYQQNKERYDSTARLARAEECLGETQERHDSGLRALNASSGTSSRPQDEAYSRKGHGGHPELTSGEE